VRGAGKGVGRRELAEEADGDEEANGNGEDEDGDDERLAIGGPIADAREVLQGNLRV
jgi:hypothetical protein